MSALTSLSLCGAKFHIRVTKGQNMILIVFKEWEHISKWKVGVFFISFRHQCNYVNAIVSLSLNSFILTGISTNTIWICKGY